MIETLGKDKPFIGTSAPIWDVKDGLQFEDIDLNGLKMHSPRGQSDLQLKRKGEEGYKTVIVRLPPGVHGPDDHAFIPAIIEASKKVGQVGYVGDGSNKWVAVHVKDAARLYVAALEGSAHGTIPGGQAVHAGEDSGHSTKELAEIIASKAGIEAASITLEQSMEWYTPFIGGMWANQRLFSTDITRKLTGWEPKENTLVEDLKGDVYFK
jgi:nucleoside-diphosphate-sugar epimerase